MKRFFAILMSCMLLLGSVSYAKALSNTDAQMLFGTQKVVKVDAVTLDKSEMAKTDGKYGWWGALAGAGTGAYGYIGYAISSHSFSWRGFGASVAGGAVAGIFLPTPTAIEFVRSSHAAMFGGFIRGWF